MSQQQPVAQEKLLSKVKEFLQIYRLVIEDGALKGYITTLSGCTEEEVDVAMDKANRENKTDFAPGPGAIFDIVQEIRAGQSAGRVFREMASWGEPQGHPDWVEDEEWKALKEKVSHGHRNT